MKLSTRRTLDLLAILVLLLFGWTIRYTARGAADPIWTAIQQRGVLRVGVDPGFKPFAEQRDGQLIGYDIDLVHALAQRLGLRVELTPVGYDALYDALSTRQVDLLAAALPLAPEQGWRARFSTAYLNAGQVLVTRRDSPIQSEGDLPDRVVGVALGSDADTLARKLRRDLPTIDVRSSYETPAAALEALAAGQLDAALTDAVSALAGAEEHANLRIVSALTFDPYVLAMPVEAYRLQAAVDSALEEMRQAGEFDRLNGRWFRPEQLR
jgi:polar amino acid transport system substrate-binding protein